MSLTTILICADLIDYAYRVQVSKQSMNSLKGNFFITFYTAGSRTKPCVVFIKVPVAVVDVVVEQLSCPGRG